MAKKIGITERTLYNWLKLSLYRERLEQARKQVRDEALNKLKDTLSKAINGLKELLDNENPNVKLKACQSVLDFNLKIFEVETKKEKKGRVFC